MRATVRIVIAILLLAAGYIALPYHSAYQLRTAIETSDVAMLDRKVDWPAVRASLKQQLTADIMQDVTAKGRSSGMEVLGAGLATVMMDKMLDAMISPVGFAQMIKGNRAKGDQPKLREDFIRRAGLVSPTRFEFELGEPGDPKRMIGTMEPYGLDWKLSKLIMNK